MTEKWQDVFVTRKEEDISRDVYGKDDIFCGSVQSVFISSEHPDTAFITEDDSDWVMPTWTLEYEKAEAKASPFRDIAVGDVVRIGAQANGGFTNYVTVLEVKHVTKLAAAVTPVSMVSLSSENTGYVVGASDADQKYLKSYSYGGLAANTSTTLATPSTTDSEFNRTIAQDGIAHICLRLNSYFNCTLLDEKVSTETTNVDYLRGYVFNDNYVLTTGKATLANRHSAKVYLKTPRKAFPDETHASEQFYFPLYLSRPWTARPLQLKLSHSIKRVHAIRLIGYTFVNKRSIGVSNGHELVQDDYLVLRVKEVEGDVISNNANAHRAFAVLQTGHSQHDESGGTEFSVYEPQGLVTLHLPSPTQNLTQLTLEVVDREGAPAKFGRFHLWFKLLVTHG